MWGDRSQGLPFLGCVRVGIVGAVVGGGGVAVEGVDFVYGAGLGGFGLGFEEVGVRGEAGGCAGGLGGCCDRLLVCTWDGVGLQGTYELHRREVRDG